VLSKHAIKVFRSHHRQGRTMAGRASERAAKRATTTAGWANSEGESGYLTKKRTTFVFWHQSADPRDVSDGRDLFYCIEPPQSKTEKEDRLLLRTKSPIFPFFPSQPSFVAPFDGLLAHPTPQPTSFPPPLSR